MKLTILHRNQPKATSKKVWQDDEHFGAVGKNKPYKWPRKMFKGQAEGWKEHQLTNVSKSIHR